MKRAAIFVGAAAIALSSSALANPIMVVNDAYVEQFPGTNHVQVTRTYSMGSTSATTVSRDGTTLAITLETFSGGSRDLGSGLSSLTTLVGCDCSVPVGQHSYVVANNTVPLNVVAASATTGTARVPSAQCDVKCASSIVAPVATGGATSVGTGGSTSSASGGATATGGATSSTTTSVVGNGGATATGGATSGTTTANEEPKNASSESSGCTFSRATGRLLPVGVLVALGLLAFRRRK